MALPFIDGLNQVLRGMVPTNNAGGLLAPQEAQDAQRQGLLGLGAGLLGAAGPNRLPVSFGQALSAAALQSNQMQNSAIDDQMKRKLLAGELFRRLQPSPAETKLVPIVGADGKPRLVPESQAVNQQPYNAETGGNSRYVLAGFTASGRPVQADRAGVGGRYADTGEPWDGRDKIVKYAIETGPAGEKIAYNTLQPGAPGGQNQPPSSVPLITKDQAIQESTEKAGSAAGAETNQRELQSRLSTQIQEGYKAADAMPVINRGIELLDEVSTGGLNAVKLKATNLFGVTGANEAELSANLGKAVLSQLRATFGAQFTAQEGARLAEIEAGFGKSTEGNKRLLEQARKLVDRVARRGIDAASRSNSQFDADEIQKAMNVSLTPSSSPSGPRQISNDDEYNALPSGAIFVGPDGKQRRKP